MVISHFGVGPGGPLPPPGDGSRSALKFLGRERGRPQRFALVFRGMRVKGTVHGGLVAVRAHAGPARCPREPRPYTGGFERGAHETLRVEAPNPEWVRDRQLGNSRHEVQAHAERGRGQWPARSELIVVPVEINQ